MDDLRQRRGEDDVLDDILTVVRVRTGVDFRGYRRPTISRRVQNRMISVGAATLPQYLDLVRSSEDEATALLDRLTIKVSRFYRNAAVFDWFRAEALPALARRAGARPLRLWSAGCGRGEEAYTLALLMEDAGLAGSVIATDIDQRALATAAEAVYPDSAMQELPVPLRDRYLEPVTGKVPQWRVRREVRARVSFFLDDMAAAPRIEPIEFDAVCCRNLLIYLAAPAQQRALDRIASCVADGGYVLLGEAEWPSASTRCALSPVVPRQRIFQARSRVGLAA